jgi:hypothetical protein
VDISLEDQGAEELPGDVKPILPYIGLFTLVTLKPAAVRYDRILTQCLPTLSIIEDSGFVEAPVHTPATAGNVVRIFHSKAINNDTPLSYGTIPLSPEDEAFTERRYWQLPASPAAIFAALLERLGQDSSQCDDIKLALDIRDTLSLQSRDSYLPDYDAGPSGGSGPSGDSGGGGSKRKGTGGSPSSSKGKKKARKAPGGGDGTEPIGKGKKKARKASGGGDGTVKSIDSGQNDTDLESGRSECILGHSSHFNNGPKGVSAMSPHDNDDPDTWRFSPSFSTNKIVFTANAV